MRLVLDTNVVVSATLRRGATYRLPDLVRQQGDSVSLFASAPMLTELASWRSSSQQAWCCARPGR